jgi:hypothetical protein
MTQPAEGEIQPRTGQQPAGWYTDYQNPAMERWWAGNRWTEQVRVRQIQMPGQQPYAPQIVVVQQAAASPRHISGLTNGERLVHIIFTVCTIGLWAPIWFLREWLGRRRIS